MSRKKSPLAEWAKMGGNALLHLLLLASRLMPRDGRRWVVGSRNGFGDNAKYFFLHVTEHMPDVRCCFICKNRHALRRMRQLGLRAFHPLSPQGIAWQLRARVFVYDMRMTCFFFWLSGDALRVNLWHGVGIKNIEFKLKRNATAAQRRRRRLRHPAEFMRPDVMLSTSPMMTRHFAACFRIPESRCVEAEYPRCELFKHSPQQLDDHLRRYESPAVRALAEEVRRARRTWIYMPTYRTDAPDILNSAGFDFRRLEEALARRNELFLLKLHPFTPVDENLSAFPHIRLLDHRMDVYPLLPLTDVLVTDYSSIYYDYLLLPRAEALLFPFDYDGYVRSAQDLAFDYDECTPGERVMTFEALVAAIESGRPFPVKERKRIVEAFWNSPQRKDLYAEIRRRAGLPAASASHA